MHAILKLNIDSSGHRASNITGMPPKKSQTKPSKTRASEKCHHRNRGYCKSKDECENKHFEGICEDIDCIEEKCEKRHPYECKL